MLKTNKIINFKRIIFSKNEKAKDLFLNIYKLQYPFPN